MGTLSVTTRAGAAPGTVDFGNCLRGSVSGETEFFVWHDKPAQVTETHSASSGAVTLDEAHPLRSGMVVTVGGATFADSGVSLSGQVVTLSPAPADGTSVAVTYFKTAGALDMSRLRLLPCVYASGTADASGQITIPSGCVGALRVLADGVECKMVAIEGTTLTVYALGTDNAWAPAAGATVAAWLTNAYTGRSIFGYKLCASYDPTLAAASRETAISDNGWWTVSAGIVSYSASGTKASIASAGYHDISTMTATRTVGEDGTRTITPCVVLAGTVTLTVNGTAVPLAQYGIDAARGRILLPDSVGDSDTVAISATLAYGFDVLRDVARGTALVFKERVALPLDLAAGTLRYCTLVLGY